MPKINTLFVIVLCVLFTPYIYAQTLFYKQFTTDDGLPTNTIYDIKEAPNGEIILGTDNGLVRYNGQQFISYNTANGLKKPFIICVQFDRSNNLYIGNYMDEIQIFEDGKFKNTGIAGHNIEEIYFTKDNSLIVYSANTVKNSNGEPTYLNKYSIGPKDVYFQADQKWIYANISLKKHVPYAMDQKGNLFIINNDSIYYTNEKIAIPKIIPSIIDVQYQNETFYLLTNKTVFKIDKKGNIINTILLPCPAIHSNFRFRFKITEDNKIFYSMQGRGLYIWHNKWTKINEFIHLTDDQHINKLFIDSKGNLWIATHERGLLFIPRGEIKHYKIKNQHNYFTSVGLRNDSIFLTTRYNLYVLKNNGIHNLYSSDQEVALYSLQNKLYLQQISLKNKKQLLFPQYYGKMLLITPSGNKIYSSSIISDVFYLKKNKVVSFPLKLETPLSDIGKINHYEQHLDTIYFNTGKSIITTQITDSGLLEIPRTLFKSSKFINCFLRVKDTFILAHTNRLDIWLKSKLIDSITKINGVNIGTPNFIKKIDDWVCIGSEKGIFFYTPKKSFLLNKYNALPNNEVTNVYKFGENWYICTKDGLAVIPEKAFTYLPIDISFQVFYQNKKVNKSIFLESSIPNIDLEIHLINFGASQNQLIEYRTNQSEWKPLNQNHLFLDEIKYGKFDLDIRVKDINSAWKVEHIVIIKKYPWYLQWPFIISLLLLVLLILYIYIKYRIKKIERTAQLKIEQQKKIAELQQTALSAQMNPHFIFNALNAIQYFIVNNEKEKGSEYLARFSRLIRLFLHHAAESYITLSEEIERLKLYIIIEQLRFPHFTYSLQLEDIDDPSTINIPNMIIQPFIENAILHGVSALREKDGHIDILFNLKDKLLTITVEDNGYGNIHKNKPSNHISKGISIIKERLYSLQASDKKGLYRVTQIDAKSDHHRPGHKVIVQISI